MIPKPTCRLELLFGVGTQFIFQIKWTLGSDISWERQSLEAFLILLVWSSIAWSIYRLLRQAQHLCYVERVCWAADWIVTKIPEFLPFIPAKHLRCMFKRPITVFLLFLIVFLTSDFGSSLQVERALKLTVDFFFFTRSHTKGYKAFNRILKWISYQFKIRSFYLMLSSICI